MNDKPVGLFLIVGAFVLILIGGLAVKFSSLTSSPPSAPVMVEDDYTKEQKEVLAAMKQMRADIEKARADINAALQSFNASAVQKGLDPNVVTTWLQVGDYGPGKNWTVVSGDTFLQCICFGEAIYG